jgi:hypothetical protein
MELLMIIKLFRILLLTAFVFDLKVNPAYAGYFETVETADEGCNLRIIRINPQSAGLYTCQHWFDQGSAQLVVLSE